MFDDAQAEILKLMSTDSYKRYRSSDLVCNYLFKIPHHPLKTTTPLLQSTISPSLKYHTALFKVLHLHLQSVWLICFRVVFFYSVRRLSQGEEVMSLVAKIPSFLRFLKLWFL